MNTPDEQRLTQTDDQEGLPSDLLTAVELARARTATPAMVKSVIARVLLQENSRTQVTFAVRGGNRRSFATVASVALVLVSASLWLGWHTPASKIPKRVELVKYPAYSPVTRVPLIQVALLTIMTDLDEIDQHLEEASESLTLAALRREIQTTIEEFRDWSK